MGCSLSAISDDMDDYESLCRQYKEKERSTPTSQGFNTSDCYGPHATLLKEASRTGETPDAIRRKRRVEARRIETYADVNLSYRYGLNKHGGTWYAVDTAKSVDWVKWLNLVSEEPKMPSLPSFVQQIENVEAFTFTDPINP